MDEARLKGGSKARPKEEETTAVHIQRGTIIAVRPSDAGHAVVAVDTERTPVVHTPSVPPGYSNRPPPPWSLDVEDETTRTWSPSLPAPPLRTHLAAPPSRFGGVAGYLGLQTAAALALIVIAGLHFSERKHRDAVKSPEVTSAAAAAQPAPEQDPVDAPAATELAMEPLAGIDDPIAFEVPSSEVTPTAIGPAPASEPVTTSQVVISARVPARDPLTVAHEALVRGHFDQSRAAYATLVARDPHNVEAMAGLADVARARGEISYAAELYGRAVDSGPSFLPARIGLADALWDTGDRTRSVAQYQAIVDGFSHVPRYVEVRAQSGSKTGRTP